ncbi:MULTISPECIES: site-2 protease family protein [Moorena]|uniref:Zinc metalloprotease n=1 Tax=Moorena producens 3L TaxID=489825 RepID=F4Y0L0_9CYAN|nr:MULTISPECIES: site-2 protease family protein [Moorena]EGJ29634.1 Zn-dependent protease [Moorena producens 3L]NEP32257.1 site-2 protease family protein [Moorena sp. SIO3B2]NEP66206.1 site-2 protease family protein [Moorena sp. SIO3A5]NER89287.1 site-2 protease family protein [Moorena sp. SIO3A2]OLT64591.1 site-2 protease family protein [Moorena producens 3L]
MNSSIRVGNLFGIPFYVNPSWFLVLALVTFDFGGDLTNFSGLSGVLPWFLGFVTALLLFASVLAHELGHSFVAIQQGIEVKSITLFLFGGLASLEKESKSPLEAFLVAIAGPAVSLLLFALLYAVQANANLASSLASIVGLLASINLALALFNLIPGLPLDGGNILKALVWQVTDNPHKGVLFASRVGQFFGWGGIIYGVLPILLYGSFNGIWFALIGLFLLQNAGMSAQSAMVQDQLDGLTAEDAVIANSPIVFADLSLREFANEYIIGKNQWRKFVVTDEAGQLLGVVIVDDLKTVPTSNWPVTPVRALIKSVKTLRTVQSDHSLLDVVKIMEKEQLEQLPVVSDNGVVMGILDTASIRSILEERKKAIEGKG